MAKTPTWLKCRKYLFKENQLLILIFRKTITINIVDQEEYEKSKFFTIELGEPRVSPADKEFYKIVRF